VPYRAVASVKYGPQIVTKFDPTRYKQNIDAVSQQSTSLTQDVQFRAAQRKAEAAMAAQEAQTKALAETQARIQARVQASQQKTAAAQADTSARYAQISKQNARLARQATKLGASAATAANPNFRGGDGRLVAVGGDASKKAAGIINEALKYRGRMYQWGGSSPQTSFDCSGLVQWAYKSMGVGLPRVSADQARSGRKVPLQALRPGDLVAWDNSSRNNGADHIAIYIGNGQIIEAPHTGAQIRVRALGNEQNAWGVQILR
jgi:cell wall-associated NlpC family hydrolase